MALRSQTLFDSEPFLGSLLLDGRYNIVLSEEQRKRAVQHVRRIWAELNLVLAEDDNKERGTKRNRNSNSFSLSPALSHSSSMSTDSHDELDDVLSHLEKQKELQPNQDRTRANLDNELTAFLQRVRVERREDLLRILAKLKLSYPCLYKVPQVAHALPTTQVSVERLFSSLKFVLSAHRSRLHDDVLDDILIVCPNYYHYYNK